MQAHNNILTFAENVLFTEGVSWHGNISRAWMHCKDTDVRVDEYCRRQFPQKMGGHYCIISPWENECACIDLAPCEQVWKFLASCLLWFQPLHCSTHVWISLIADTYTQLGSSGYARTNGNKITKQALSLGKTKGHNRSWLKDQLAMCTSSSIEPFWPYVKHTTLHHIFFLDKTYMRRLSAVESGSILTFVHKWRGVWCPDRGWALPPTVSLGRGVSLHSPYLSLHLQPDPHSLESNIRHPTQRVIISFGSTTRSVCFKLLYMCWHLCT